MINPSASGWIDKYFLKQKNKKITYDTPNLFYTTIRKTGFIYGHCLFETSVPIITKGWVQNEIPKVALLIHFMPLRLSQETKS
jgi:hypothetical protein